MRAAPEELIDGEGMTTRRSVILGAAALAAGLGRVSRRGARAHRRRAATGSHGSSTASSNSATISRPRASRGKRLAVMWELKGCPYCKETHFVNFGRSDIADFVRANFDILQLNIIGSRKVTDFDGAELTEKQIAGQVWRALHADLPVLSRHAPPVWVKSRGEARGRPHGRLLSARRLLATCSATCAKRPMKRRQFREFLKAVRS